MKILLLLTMGIVSASVAAADSPRTVSPFACKVSALSPEARKRHFEELGPALGGMVKKIREVADGFEFELPSDAATIRLVSEWAVGEHLCCPFFDIDLRWEREDGGLWLRLTGREGVKAFIQEDFARWFRQVRTGAHF